MPTRLSLRLSREMAGQRVSGVSLHPSNAHARRYRRTDRQRHQQQPRRPTRQRVPRVRRPFEPVDLPHLRQHRMRAVRRGACVCPLRSHRALFRDGHCHASGLGLRGRWLRAPADPEQGGRQACRSAGSIFRLDRSYQSKHQQLQHQHQQHNNFIPLILHNRRPPTRHAPEQRLHATL